MDGGEDPLYEERLRQTVVAEIGEQQRRAEEDGRSLDVVDQRQIARAVLQRELDLRDRAALAAGELPTPEAERSEIADRVLSQVFSTMPGLERFFAESVTNVHILGSREVVVEHLDGSRHRYPSPYGSDAEVIEAVAHMARRAGVIEKPFNYANPLLHMVLADGSRLTAAGWLGEEPHVTVRRHPLMDHDLDDLQRLDMMSPGLRSLLAAAVRAKWNILVAGGPSHGKTTLLRALAHEADPDERLLVLESEPELWLERMPDRHRHVVALRERPGNAEGDGAVTMSDLVWNAKRQSPDRIIVGEVLGAEVMPMLEALTQGVRGSMATIHSESVSAVFPRLPIYARFSGQYWLSDDVLQAAAVALDLLVFVARDRAKKRYVAAVRHIGSFDFDTGRIISDAWLTPSGDGRAVPASVIPVALLDELVEAGYDPSLPLETNTTAGGAGGNGAHSGWEQDR